MGITDRYRNAADMPRELAMFPLRGAILLPRASLTLNVFEPRYLALVDHVLAGNRLIGVVQPAPEAGDAESPKGRTFPLRSVGCAGRLFSFIENDDGRVVIAPFADDFITGCGEEEVDRPRLLAALKNYLTASNLNADWDRINGAPSERLVNTLSILSPYGPEEKQALLEAPDLRSRAEALVALAEMELATRDDGSGTSLQ